MYKTLKYTLIFVVVILLQSLIFDKLTVSMLVAPLIYTVAIFIMPIESSQSKMLLVGTLLGVLLDVTTGMAGINAFSTIFISYTRIYLLNLIYGKELISLGGIPTYERFGLRRYITSMVAIVYIHAAIYFALESMNILTIWVILQQVLFSGTISLLFVWLLASLFQQLLIRKK